MARRIELTHVTDMTGGLNLKADAFLLAENESPDLLNVDIDPRGGFRARKVVAPLHANDLSGAIKALWAYSNGVDVEQVLVQVGNDVLHGTGGEFTDMGLTGSPGGIFRAATFANKHYIARNGAGGTLRWDGTTSTSLASAFNNDYTSAVDGNIPRSKLIAAHMGYLWVANTVETAVAFENRVRFSHPNKPERWRDFDFIDVDPGVDGDEIIGLVPFEDRLLVFKEHSVHAIYGHSPSTFQVQPITREVGAISQDAIRSTDEGVYFFSWPEGVFLYDGKSVKWQFEKLYPAILDGTIPHAEQDEIHLGWGNHRLWVSVPWEGSTTRSRVFVLDPLLGKSGSWTAYDLALGTFLEWNPPGANARYLASSVDRPRVLLLEQDGATDDIGGGAVHVDGHYMTGWFDLDQPAVKKRWKRPEFVLKGGTTATLFAEAYRDYDPSELRRHFTLRTEADADFLIWDVSNWDEGVWARGGASRNEVRRGAPLGTSRSIALKVRGPAEDADWGVDSVTLKYIQRPVRS